MNTRFASDSRFATDNITSINMCLYMVEDEEYNESTFQICLIIRKFL